MDFRSGISPSLKEFYCSIYSIINWKFHVSRVFWTSVAEPGVGVRYLPPGAGAVITIPAPDPYYIIKFYGKKPQLLKNVKIYHSFYFNFFVEPEPTDVFKAPQHCFSVHYETNDTSVLTNTYDTSPGKRVEHPSVCVDHNPSSLTFLYYLWNNAMLLKTARLPSHRLILQRKLAPPPPPPPSRDKYTSLPQHYYTHNQRWAVLK